MKVDEMVCDMPPGRCERCHLIDIDRASPKIPLCLTAKGGMQLLRGLAKLPQTYVKPPSCAACRYHSRFSAFNSLIRRPCFSTTANTLTAMILP